MNRPAPRLLAALALSIVAGCGDRNPIPIRPKDYVDETVTSFRPITTLGIEGHPATIDLWVEEGAARRPRHPGGFVVRVVAEDGPSAGRLRVGDVIHRVADRDVANVEDPTVDLVAALEEAAAGEGRSEVTLGVLRRGRPAEATVELELGSLDEGLPGTPPRLLAMAERALDALAHAQSVDGGFASAEEAPDARLVVAATAGVAFLASGSDLERGARATNVRLCLEAVRRELEAKEKLRVPGLAWATIFLGELLGRGPDPDLLALAAGTLGRLVAMQRDDGGFPLGDPEESLGYCDRTFATHLALTAVGVAERAGIAPDAEVVPKACAYLKERMNGGEVVFSIADGFDRRTEAGRAGGAAVALRTLNVTRSDPFFTSLVEYHRPLAADVVDAPRGAPWHGLFAAVLAHQGGTGGRLTFHHAQKFRLVAWQRPDGSFAIPRSPRPYTFEREADGAPLATAIGAILLRLGEGDLPLLLARRDHPMQPRRDGDGASIETDGGAPAPEGPPDGAKVMKFGSLDEAREFLESMGIDPDQVQGNVDLGGDERRKREKKDG